MQGRIGTYVTAKDDCDNPCAGIGSDFFKKALGYSFLLLKYRQRSKAEVIFRLKRKKFPAAVIEKVLSYLEEKNYINDQEFAKLFVSSCQNKGWGQKKICFALKKLGVKQGLIEANLGEREEYREKIREIIKKKIAADRRGKNRYQKILRYLRAKGFRDDDIFRELNACGIDKFRT